MIFQVPGSYQNSTLWKILINSRPDCSGWQNHVILSKNPLVNRFDLVTQSKKFADPTDNFFLNDRKSIFNTERKVFSALTEHCLKHIIFVYQFPGTSGQESPSVSMEDWMRTETERQVTASAAAFWRLSLGRFWF